MDIGLRLLIRSLQIGVLPRFGRRIDYILRDIDRLLADTTQEHGWAVTGLAMYAVTSLAATDPDRTLGYLRRALTLPEELPGPAGENLSLPADLHLDELLWSMIARIDTATRLRDWIATAELLPDPRLARLFQSPLARLGSLVLADRLSVEELRRPPEARRWHDVLPSLDQLSEWADGKHLPLLWACAARSKVYAFGEMGLIDQALVVGEEALGSSLHGNVDEAFSAQLATMEGLFAWYPPDSPTHHQLLLPYIERFWTMAFCEARFQFRSPSLVETELAQARNSPASKRVRAILRAVRLGVNVRGLDQALLWLASDAS